MCLLGAGEVVGGGSAGDGIADLRLSVILLTVSSAIRVTCVLERYKTFPNWRTIIGNGGQIM